MTNQSPAAKLEAKANREQSKLLKAHDELQMVASVIKHSDLPADVKIRLFSALKQENEMIQHDQERIAGFRKAAEISRGKQWVTQSED